jgi:hypothetical protein
VFGAILPLEGKITNCLMTWAAPVVDPNDTALAMAERERMALAAQKEPPVRRMQSVRRTEERADCYRYLSIDVKSTRQKLRYVNQPAERQR